MHSYRVRTCRVHSYRVAHAHQGWPGLAYLNACPSGTTWAHLLQRACRRRLMPLLLGIPQLAGDGLHARVLIRSCALYARGGPVRARRWPTFALGHLGAGAPLVPHSSTAFCLWLPQPSTGPVRYRNSHRSSGRQSWLGTLLCQSWRCPFKDRTHLEQTVDTLEVARHLRPPVNGSRGGGGACAAALGPAFSRSSSGIGLECLQVSWEGGVWSGALCQWLAHKLRIASSASAVCSWRIHVKQAARPR